MTLAALWATTSLQLFTDWRQQKARSDSSHQASVLVAVAFYGLQEERRLSAADLADPGTYRTQLKKQRDFTDAAMKKIEDLDAGGFSAPSDIKHGVTEVIAEQGKLTAYREAVDHKTASQQETYDAYTGLVATDLQLFTSMSKLGMDDIDYRIRPANDSLWGMEMISRESAIVTRAGATGKLTADERGQLSELVGAQAFIYDNKVVPAMSADMSARYRKLLAGSAWKQKTAVEQSVLHGSSSGTTTFSPTLAKKWGTALGQVAVPLQTFNADFWTGLLVSIDDELNSLERRLVLTSLLGAGAVILVIAVSTVLTRTLRRRIFALRQAALDLQTRMPDVVERMRRGEPVDPDAELPPIQHAQDELGQLGEALNLARHSALDTTMTQVSQFRGFEKLLQRIARRTQLLIGLQMKKLSELERRHEDPEVLEGLFDLDHLTARLRRYEENLVILGGGQPQRRWRKPVLMVDVLRSAQSEVQDYRRVQIEVDGRVWLSERAVGLVVHVLAELMENAVSFSRPPTPVEVYASRVGRGLAVEIEDRGMGMTAEEYDEANRLMADPPRMDVLSRAEDIRLGLYVVARLAQGLGIQVELRPSSFGGTRVVVLIPAELVIDEDARRRPEAVPDLVPEPVGASEWPPMPDEMPAMASGPTTASGPGMASGPTSVPGPRTEAFATTAHPGFGDPFRSGAPSRSGVQHGRTRTGPPPSRSGSPEPGGLPSSQPLPKRVRMASLVDELRDPDADVRPAAEERSSVRKTGPGRSGATVGAFQRRSRMARQGTPATQAATTNGGSPTRAGTADDSAGKQDRTEVLPYRRRIPTED
ncbi:nitrate- and nitrite sensing domain-containing protein [Streptomyces galilaeus]